MNLYQSFAFTLLASAAAAQAPAVISPATAATALGNSNNSIPFSWTPTAYQQVHDRTSFSNTNPTVFMSMRLRMASGFTNRPGQTIDLEMHFANSPVDAMSASSVFANNIIAASEVPVFTRKMVNLPQVPDNNWSIVFPLDAPFVFTGVQHFSWRAIVHGNSNNNQLFTYPLDAWTGTGTSARTGSYVGCQSASGTRAATHTATWGTLRIGNTASFTGNSFVPTGNLPALLTIGGSSSMYGALPLPFDMAPIGAPGCQVVNDILLTIGGLTTANANGSVVLTVGVPADPSMQGGMFFTQFFFLEATANALGLFTSNGQTNTIGTLVGMTRIYASNNPLATSGTVGTDFGISVGFN